MNKKEKYATLAVLVLLLLYILWKKKGMPTITSVSSQLLDSNTQLPIIDGISNSPQAIGPVTLPPGVPNQFNDSRFINAVKNPPLPLCPTGYHPVLDPSTGAAYCVISSYVPSQTFTTFS